MVGLSQQKSVEEPASLVGWEFISQRIEIGLIFRARLIALVQQLDLWREHRSAWVRAPATPAGNADPDRV